MHRDTIEAFDIIDAAIFSGDEMHDSHSLRKLQYYVYRWASEIPNIKEIIEKNTYENIEKESKIATKKR